MNAGLAMQAYRQISHEGVAEDKLLVLGLDGILEYLRRTRAAIADKAVARKAASMLKAQQLVEHLLVALPEPDAPESGELSERMRKVYRYLLERLAHANIFDDLQALDDCTEVVTSLRVSWVEALRKA
jgi:flagellar protein FliS